MRILTRTLTFAAAFSLGAVPAAAQVVTTMPARGWIGVSVEVLTTDGGGSPRTLVTVTDVIEGGPAARAGVRPGDVVVAVNGRSWEKQFGGISQALSPGDPVRMVVERDGRRREFQVTAAPRPADMAVAPQSWSFTVRADSMVDRMYRAMDSLRIRLIREPDGTLAMVGEPGSGDSLTVMLHRIPGGSMRVKTSESGRVISVSPVGADWRGAVSGVLVPEVRAPFPFFIFRGEEYDSLHAEMQHLNQEIRDLRSRQAARARELAARSRDGRIDRNDEELRHLEEAMRKVDAEASELRAAMEQTSRREAGERFSTTWVEAPTPPTAEAAPHAELARARPLAAYVLGQNRAAGAEVVDLRPELAAYFQVRGGVLVVDVPEGTPASLAGIQPGDVVIRVDDRDVRSIQDLREGLARSTPEIPVTLVRKGKQMQVLLRR